MPDTKQLPNEYILIEEINSESFMHLCVCVYAGLTVLSKGSYLVFA